VNIAETVVFLVKGTDIRHYQSRHHESDTPPQTARPGPRAASGGNGQGKAG
jgi:hypothetical protein